MEAIRMNWKRSLGGLISAASGGILTALTTYTFDPMHFNLHYVGPTISMGALIGVLAYLKQPAPQTTTVEQAPPPPPVQFPGTR
jgi:hypothetical protein